MAKKSYIGVGGKARKIKKWYVGVGNKARKVKKGYIGVGGVARPFMSGGELEYYGTITPLSVARDGLAGATVGNYALFAGGHDHGIKSTVDAYNTSLVRSTPTALSQARMSLKGESIGNYAWASNDVNEWTTASLNTYLNGDYYNGLSEEAKAMLGDTKYYLGGSASNKSQSGPTYYAFERGTTVYRGRSTNWIGKIGLMYPSDYAYTYANGVDNK